MADEGDQPGRAGSIAGDVLKPELIEEIITEARALFEASARPDDRGQRRRDLEAVEQEQARLTDAIVAGGTLQVLVERLKATETKRRVLAADLDDEVRQTRPLPAWREIEQRVRQSLADWRAMLTGEIWQARTGFRQLLTTPILFTPFVKNGRRGIRFEGRIGLAAILGGEVVMSFLGLR
jgi:hypothetical protein